MERRSTKSSATGGGDETFAEVTRPVATRASPRNLDCRGGASGGPISRDIISRDLTSRDSISRDPVACTTSRAKALTHGAIAQCAKHAASHEPEKRVALAFAAREAAAANRRAAQALAKRRALRRSASGGDATALVVRVSHREPTDTRTATKPRGPRARSRGQRKPHVSNLAISRAPSEP